MSDAVLKKTLDGQTTTTHNTGITPRLFGFRISEIADKIQDNNQDKNVYATPYSTKSTSPPTDKAENCLG